MTAYKDYGIGAVSKKNENYFEWILSDFSTLEPYNKNSIWSPCCYFNKHAFRLQMGLKSAEHNGVPQTEYWTEVGFDRNSKTTGIEYQVRMGLLGKNDEEKLILTGKTYDLEFWYCKKMETSVFKRIIDDNKGHLRIFYAILHEDEDINAAKFTSLGLKTGSMCSKNRATTCGFAGCASHKPSTGVLFQGIEKLLEDFQLLLSSEDESDVTLKVRGRCFKVHKNILMFRSPVFYSMFKQDPIEKDKEIIIDDCAPETFPEFLSYLYTGRISNLTSDKTASLAHTAEKFGLDDLKKECIDWYENYRKERSVLKARKNTKPV